ncbi:MAG: phenylalanine--tRNA ligase subunit alpha [Asgard group archaeon]|nr:phenylalanine--tRNA ligase subunit alpha [Asgard group archaeon]
MTPKKTLTKAQAEIMTILAKEREISQKELVRRTNKEEVKVVQTILELSEEGYITTYEKLEQHYFLTEEGKDYNKNGLPEKQLLEELQNKKEELVLLEDFTEETNLPPKIVNIAIGWMKRKKWVEFTKKEKKTYLKIKEREKKDIDAQILEQIEKRQIDQLNKKKEMKTQVKTLEKRGLVTIQEEKTRFVKLTNVGEKLLDKGYKIQEKMETLLTPEMIITGSWKEKKFKAYDPTIDVPKTYVGRKHPILEVINELREILLEMGFKEIRGPLVESEFWNFDALFQPQDHPARMLHDTFKIEYPKKADLPPKKVVNKVKKTHENGWKTRSTGWNYPWEISQARKLVLRTHTTATTVKHLAKAHTEWTPPERVFSIDRVYRNESVDYKHLAEFMQFEGIVVEKDASLRNLMGYLKTFYGKMGFDKIRLIPCYFPYTEPSISTLIYVDKFDSWFEMGGSGIFRPEVTLPFGVKERVLAWGQGLDRLVMLKLDIEDIRDVYTTDINRLRTTPLRF